MLRLAALGLGLIQIRLSGQPKPPETVLGSRLGQPVVHLDHPVGDVEAEAMDEPVAHLAHGQPVAHRHRAGADEALLPRQQQSALDRAPGGIGPVEHPDLLAVPGRLFEQIEQRGAEGVNPAAEVLQVEQEHVGGAHHLPGRAAHLAVEAEQRDAVARVGLVRGLDHVVLLVALDPVLRAERGGDIDAGGDQRVEAMRKVERDRSRMRDQRDALTFEGPAQLGLGEQAVDAEFHAPRGAASSAAKQAAAWKSGAPSG